MIVLITLAGGYYYYFAHPYDGEKLAEIEQVATKTWKNYREIVTDNSIPNTEKLEMFLKKHSGKLRQESIQLIEDQRALERIGDRITPWNKSKFKFVLEYVKEINGVLTIVVFEIKEKSENPYVEYNEPIGRDTKNEN